MNSRQSCAPAFIDFDGLEPVPEAPLSGVAPRAAVRAPAPPAVPSAALEPYMHLVHQTVGRFLRRLPRSVLREDLVAAGTFGLMTAIQKHVGPRDAQFEWYARVRIRGAILDELRQQDWLPRTQRAKASAGRPSQPPALVLVSIDNASEHPPAVATSEDASPLALVERQSEYNVVGKMLEHLPPREQEILNLHYFEGLLFRDIADKLGVSQPRVSQLHARALERLKQMMVEDQPA